MSGSGKHSPWHRKALAGLQDSRSAISLLGHLHVKQPVHRHAYLCGVCSYTCSTAPPLKQRPHLISLFQQFFLKLIFDSVTSS